jgi:RNase P/RNase MRP subunit p29
MKISKYNIHAHELMGLYVKCIDKKGKLIHEGIVYNETKNQIWLKRDKMIKKLLKVSYDFIFNYNGQSFKLVGRKLIGEPEERAKKL